MFFSRFYLPLVFAHTRFQVHNLYVCTLELQKKTKLMFVYTFDLSLTKAVDWQKPRSFSSSPTKLYLFQLFFNYFFSIRSISLASFSSNYRCWLSCFFLAFNFRRSSNSALFFVSLSIFFLSFAASFTDVSVYAVIYSSERKHQKT